ncbi:MAG TPA: hypothetical protein VMF90_14730 [Rhizobiaceae bacterium]|nr:hypothetical protein [Rhizobiaceae bacterium]
MTFRPAPDRGRQLDKDLPRSVDAYAPALRERLRAERRESVKLAQATVPRGRALNIYFHHELADDIRAAAAERNVMPSTLLAALARRALDSGMLDALIGETRPEELAGRQGRNADRLTLRQQGVLYLIEQGRDKAGLCTLTSVAIARRMPGTRAQAIVRTLEALAVRGLIYRQDAPKGWRLTRLGEDFADRLEGGPV